MNIAILTTARSDFGLLKRVIRHAAQCFDVDLLVAGSHFLASRGESFQEVQAEFGNHAGVRIVPIRAMEETSTPAAQVQSMAQTQIEASRWFAANPCELLLFLGDRWELWGVTVPAFLHGIPLAHISGGEVTEGVIDDSVRHAHTKISALHFAATDAYAHNISRMGEEDWRICVVGECGLDLIHQGEVATHAQVQERFGVDLAEPTILVTFHPSTLDATPAAQQIDALLRGLDAFREHQIVFTAPGVEQGSDVVLAAIGSFVAAAPNRRLIEHFGSRNYLAVLQAAKVVVGNSSSGVVEAASFGVPAVNVGQRQKNRLAADSVQHLPYEPEAIQHAIAHALSAEYQQFARGCPNPYDPYRDGQNSLRIVQALKQAQAPGWRERLRLKKFDAEVRPADWNTLLKEAG
jgi:GDP/UDP-N,N'-diacetylbacillosamine 2-epimerase (hydrolysing)